MVGDQPRSLFQWIRNTHKISPAGVLSAYTDNAAVVEGPLAERFHVNPLTNSYRSVLEPIHLVMKVETHNHPTAVSPNPGAATGAGGEIRDEGATGRGAKPKAGLTGFSVNYLRIPELEMPWEHDLPMPSRLASSLQVMLEAPIGGAAFNNEFGRPNLNGYFRAYEASERIPSGSSAPWLCETNHDCRWYWVCYGRPSLQKTIFYRHTFGRLGWSSYAYRLGWRSS